MGTICSSGRISVLKATGGGMDVTIYANELEAVFGLIGNGSLGGGLGYGDKEHKAALKVVASYVDAVQKEIALAEMRDDI